MLGSLTELCMGRQPTNQREILLSSSPKTAADYPYAFHVALDGNGINGLEGLAGVCVFLYDPDSGDYAHKIRYFDGISAGHAVSVNPSGTIGFLGNASQHLLFYDANTLEELGRISTLRFEPASNTIQGSTHVTWLDDHTVITSFGQYFYQVDVRQPERAERLGPHLLKLAHAMKRTPSGRYICYGGMDHPATGAAREVGIWNIASAQARRVEIPTTCWHVASHKEKDLFYALSFRVLPQNEDEGYHEWSMAFRKEYAFEINAETAQVERHWAAGREVPAHINSDVCTSDSELIFCNGASQTIVMVDLGNFSSYRIIDERPNLRDNLRSVRQIGTQVFDVLARGGAFTSTRHLMGALRVSRFTLNDSVHACQLSANQRLLFTANRGMNHITIYDYPSAELRLRVQMPAVADYSPHSGSFADPRLGFHHSHLISDPAPAPL